MHLKNSRNMLNFVIVLFATLLVTSTVLFVVSPIFHFPNPTGIHEIGTVTYHWIDEVRPEIFTTNSNVHRELIVQVWYPARGNKTAPRTLYLSDADSLTLSLARLNQMPEFTLKLLKYVTTNAAESLPVAHHETKYPMLIFLQGANGFRQMNTYQVEELVSHGYIVVAIDQPYTAASVVFPDSHQTLGLPLKLLKQLIRQSYSSADQVPTLNGRTFKSGIINYLAQDVIFTLNQLSAINLADPKGILTNQLNLDRIGIFGISLGGIIVGEACMLDSRLRACLVMDAPMPLSVIKSGLQQPTMWITRDAKSMQLEGWPQIEIDEHQSTMRAAFENLKADGYFIQVRGLFHINMTDIPLWSPLVKWLGVSGPIDGKLAHEVINRYTLTFFNRHVNGQSNKKFSELNREYSEVHFEARRSEYK